MTELHFRAHMVLFGLTEDLSNELRGALSRIGAEVDAQPVHSPEECLNIAESFDRGVLVCDPDSALVRELRALCPNAVIVAAARIADTDAWIDIIEAGADDYCAAPFETAQLRWIFQSNLVRQRLAA